MISLVLNKNSDLSIEERMPPLGIKELKNKVCLKVLSAGICGSDIQRAFNNKAYYYPLVMGHEFSGEVILSSESSAYRNGDKVVVFPLVPCMNCPSCQIGEYAQCFQYKYFGSSLDGGFCEYIIVPEANLVRIPEHVDIIHASMTEPCAVAFHGVKKMNILPGETGLVMGAGPVGLMAAQWMKVNGCKEVFITEVDEKKIEIAEKLGMTAINSNKDDVVDFVMKATAGKGIKYIIEACGLPITFRDSILCGSRQGKILFMGNILGNLVLAENEVSNILRKELTIFGTWNSRNVPTNNNEWSTVLDYLDKKIIVEPLISHIVPLSAGPDIFNRINKKQEYFNKVIFDLRNE